MILYWMTILTANAENARMAGYLKSVLSTAAVMPVTYVVSDALTETSNQLVKGMLPPVLTGVLAPAFMASASSAYFGGVYDIDSHSRFGTVATVNLGLYAGGTAIGVSTHQWKDALLYGALTAVLLPIPCWVGAQDSKAHLTMSIHPAIDTEHGEFQAQYRRSF